MRYRSKSTEGETGGMRRQMLLIICLSLLSSISGIGRSRAAPETAARDLSPEKNSTKTATSENPFLRSSGAELPTEKCLTMNLDKPHGSASATMAISNQCDYPVAVLTAPLEVRLRRTGKEAWIYERRNGAAAYAILYVIAAKVRDRAFVGDGIVRCGGAQVRRPPGYWTVPAMGKVSVPFNCNLDVPRGQYFLPMMTFEARQGDAPLRSDPFDCSESVARYNSGASEAVQGVELGSEARPLSSRSIAMESGWPVL